MSIHKTLHTLTRVLVPRAQLLIIQHKMKHQISLPWSCSAWLDLTVCCTICFHINDSMEKNHMRWGAQHCLGKILYNRIGQKFAIWPMVTLGLTMYQPSSQSKSAMKHFLVQNSTFPIFLYLVVSNVNLAPLQHLFFIAVVWNWSFTLGLLRLNLSMHLDQQ